MYFYSKEFCELKDIDSNVMSIFLHSVRKDAAIRNVYRIINDACIEKGINLSDYDTRCFSVFCIFINSTLSDCLKYSDLYFIEEDIENIAHILLDAID